jgi:hypothetical protein
MAAEPIPLADHLHELEILRHDYRVAMSATADAQERYRLYRIVQELNAWIERLQQQSSH